MKDKEKKKDTKDLKKQISELQIKIAEHKKSEDALRQALRREYDDREKRIMKQTSHLMSANKQLRQEIKERERAEDALHYRAELERLITTLSTSFIKLSPDDIDTEINKALETIGRFICVDRTYVFIFSDDGKRISDVYEWCAEGLEPQIHRIKGRSIEDEFPWSAEKIKKRGIFHLSFSDDLLIDIKEYLKAHEIQSLIELPMFYGMSFIGFVGFYSVRTKKTWEIDIIVLLRLVGEIFANAIERKRMELALRKSENKYRLLFESASDPIAVLDAAGAIQDCNLAYTALIGMDRKEITGKSLSDFIAQGYKGRFLQGLKMVKEDGNGESELKINSQKGKTSHIWCKITAISDETGKFRGMFAHCRDITARNRDVEMLRKAHEEMKKKVVEHTDDLIQTRTSLDRERAERKRAEDAIRLAHSKIDQIFNTAADAMGIIDSNFNVLQVNNALLKVFAIGKDDLLNKKCYELFPSSLCDSVDCPMIKIPQKGVQRFEKRIDVRLENDLKVPFILTATPFYGNGGEFIGVVEDFKDVRDLPNIDGDLREGILKDSKIFDIFFDGFYMTDNEWNFVYTNQTFSDLVGYSKEELLRMKIGDLYFKDGSDDKTEIPLRDIQKGLETGYLHKDGRIVNVCVKASPVKIGSNNLLVASVRKVPKPDGKEKPIKFLSSFMEYCTEGIALIDLNDDLLYINKAFSDIHGFVSEKVIGKHLSACLSSQQKQYIDMTEYQIHEKEGFTVEVWYPGANGKLFPAEISRIFISDHSGNPLGKLIKIKDITDKKRFNEIAKENLETEKAFLNVFDDSAILLDKTGIILALNERAARWLGKKIDEMVGQSIYDFFQPDLAKQRKARIEEVICSAREINCKEYSGDEKFDMNICPVLNEQGKVVKVAIILKDISGLIWEHQKSIGQLSEEVSGRHRDYDYSEVFRKRGHKEGLRNFSIIKRSLDDKERQHNYRFNGITGRNETLWELFDILPSVAASVSTVLIQGESGTGKHLLARAIHDLSPRKDKPFITINCGALPDTLLESELFGYKAGAFTDAKKDKLGRFAIAEGGTLFLDEIGDISPAMQVRLLRFLQERVYEPLGSEKTLKADVRIITATNKNLMGLVKEGRFREDLYYRINVVKLDLPPLRERLEDVPLLVDHFIAQMNKQQGKKITGIDEEAMVCLLSYDYPGNIRELENIIERCYVLCPSDEIKKSDLPDSLCSSMALDCSEEGNLTTFMKMEAAFLMNVLRQNNWSRIETARQLGIHKATLFRKIKSLGLKLPPPSKKTDL